MHVLAQDTIGWWCVSGVHRHRLSPSEANQWLYLGVPAYPLGDSFAALLIGSSVAV